MGLIAVTVDRVHTELTDGVRSRVLEVGGDDGDGLCFRFLDLVGDGVTGTASLFKASSDVVVGCDRGDKNIGDAVEITALGVTGRLRLLVIAMLISALPLLE